MGWLAAGFVHPERVDLPGGQHLRPIRGADVVSWWVVDEQVGGELEPTLDRFVPQWLAETWRFRSVRYSP